METPVKFLLSIIVTIIVTLALPVLAAAHDYRLGDLEIIHPFIYETAKTARAGGGYVTIANTGSEADRLIGVRADFPKVQIHESYEENGVHRMRPAGELTIAPGETLELAPGGYHVMFMGLSKPFEAGEEVPVTLIFERAGEIEVRFRVVPRDEGMDHGQMKQSDSD